MTIIDRLINRGYYDVADDDGVPAGGGADDTADDQSGKTADEITDKGTDAADKDADEKPEPTIPKSRFDQAVNKARQAEQAAQRRAEELEAKLKAQEGTVDAAKLESEIDDLEDKLEDAVRDGNAEAKKRIRAEIRAKNQQLAEGRASAHAARATAVAIEQIRYDAVVERLETQYPELNPDSDAYDEDVVGELMELKTAFEATGLSSSEALKKSVGVHFRGAPAPKAAAKEDDAADDKADDAAARLAQRKEAAVKKGLDTKGKQPADTRKAGLDGTAAGKNKPGRDVSKMSEAEYDKLPEEEKKRLRGDII